MSDFDPDAYLAKLQAKPAAPAADAPFDPDAYLAKKVSGWTALGRGGLQGATLGFGDELAGGMTGAIQGAINLLPKSLAQRWDWAQAPAADAYRYSRDEERQANAAAEAAHKGLYLGGNVAGGLATLPFGGGLTAAKGAGLGARLAVGAANGGLQGAAYGLGASNADLTQGQVGQAARDTAMGGALGGGLGAAGAAVGAGLSALGTRAQRGMAQALADETARQTAAKAKAVASAAGELGGVTASTLKTLERLQEVLADPAASAQMKTDAQVALSDPRMQQALQAARAEYVRKAPQQLQAIEAARQGLTDANAIDVAAATQEGLANPIRKQVLPRAMKYLSRMVPTMAGGAVGGTPGAVVGSVVGNAVGAPGTAMANMMKSPAVRNMLWRALANTAGAGGRLESALEPSVTRLGYLGAPEAQALLPQWAMPGPAQEEDPQMMAQLARAAALRRR